MGSRSNELRPDAGTALAGSNNALQNEADAARFSGHGLIDSFQNAVSDIPAPLVGAIGIAGGLAARLPGDIGIVGKAVTLGMGITFASDAALRLTGLSQRTDNTSAFIRDGLALGSLGLGMSLGSKLLSRSSQTPMIEKLASQDLETGALAPKAAIDGGAIFKPIVGRAEDGSIMLVDGKKAASLVNGQWQPGIAFDRNAINEMRQVRDQSEIARLFGTADSALNQSIEQAL